jgi:hypothetical protein
MQTPPERGQRKSAILAVHLKMDVESMKSKYLRRKSVN